MSAKLEEIYIQRIDEMKDHVKNHFVDLSPEILNWKPSQSGWSIAQCLDHLIITDNLYLRELGKINKGSFNKTIWHRIPLIPDILGNLLLKTVSPNNKKKVKTFQVFKPTVSQVSYRITEDFLEHLESMKEVISMIIQKRDINMVMHSPVNNKITLRIRHVLEMLTLHTKRHLIQAGRVLEEFQHQQARSQS